MARLRIRIELSRGGLGVPLHKMASVIAEAQRFFLLLGEDVHIDKTKGEWLGFDFDNESLNFTAEFVGPVTTDQVQAFHAAFDGTTSLRRGTIAQFARITEAIGEDELIGFGLYQSDEVAEPTEWRCLSRRDALRIADEIQLLVGASAGFDQEGFDQESHLPAVRDPHLGARMFGDRRDRSVEHEKWAGYVREVETTLSNRLTKVEDKVEQHTGIITDLRTQSTSTQESFRSLLSAVENFCNQATHQVERIAPAALLEAPRGRRFSWSDTWVIVALAVTLSCLMVVLTMWLLPARSDASAGQKAPATNAVPQTTVAQAAISPAGSQPTAAATPAASAQKPVGSSPSPVKTASVPPQSVASPAAKPVGTTAAENQTADGPVMRLALEASEPSWVSLTEVDGTKLVIGLIEPGSPRTVELTKAATLRTGNAGGLEVRVDGKSIGSLGPRGKVRQVEFRDGQYKLSAIE